jgi:catechol 2,3-dioxygenase-like lactoylglutathione lyase family enzyme
MASTRGSTGATSARRRYDVGGVLLEQPFKIRRLGHFGMNVDDLEACRAFYCDLLGFRVSDPEDIAANHPDGERLRRIANPNIYFLRHGTDHHSLVLFDRRVMHELSEGRLPPDMSVNQLTWQVGSLAELAGAIEMFKAHGVPIHRVGRDMPGSNWHVYPFDPEGHRNELYYGMEQIGWNGASKPRAAYDRGFEAQPTLPQIPEFQEVDQLMARGVDLASGFRHAERMPARYDVDGVLLPRPFKIVRHGPLRLFAKNVDALLPFYADTLGLIVTEEIRYQGQRCVFLRCNTEHHVLALYPIELRAALGLARHTTVMSFGMQIATYRQLKDAVRFLLERGCKFLDIPRALTPGIDYSVHVLDPAGHAIQLYYAIDQVGWNGEPRPRTDVADLSFERWPDTVPGASDTYMGEPYLGPWG